MQAAYTNFSKIRANKNKGWYRVDKFEIKITHKGDGVFHVETDTDINVYQVLGALEMAKHVVSEYIGPVEEETETPEKSKPKNPDDDIFS